MKALAMLLLLAVAGCAKPEAPRTYRIDADFTEEQADSIRLAVALWVDALDGDWAPREVTAGGDVYYEASTDVDWFIQGLTGCRTDENGESCATGHHSDGHIRIRMTKVRSFVTTVAHETGHLCAGHTDDPESLMYYMGSAGVSSRFEGSAPYIDQASVDAWRRGCL